MVRGYDGGAPLDKLLIIKGCDRKYIYVSLLFPKLKKNVKEIDIIEALADKEALPSNDDGVAKSYFDVKIDDYIVSSKRKQEGILLIGAIYLSLKMNMTMKNTMVWIITIVLMSVDVYIIFTDPLERQYDLVQIVMAWYLVTLLLDFLFRHNNTYGVIRNVIATVLLCVLYFVFP